ncbi:MAG: hypothetical protein M5U12_20030 [Verrucomicrobia bacterium]|nr:hypothetical protein [Verrucomicrobiota bacterium]
MIDQALFLELADSFTTSDESLESGLINVNTAGVDVLVCLPGVSVNLPTPSSPSAAPTASSPTSAGSSAFPA